MSPSAVLLMAYGTPAALDDVAAYYTHIRRGRPPTPAEVAHLVERYRAIGGTSPLLAITREVAAALSARLGLPVYVGMKHWHPFIADVVAQMHQDGIARAAAVVLAPHYSRLSVGAYLEAAQEAAARCGGPALAAVEAWHLHPGLVAVLADRVRTTLGRLPAEAHLLFTAHSLPKRILEWGDPYPAQLVASARAVAAAAGAARWSFAFQSASATGEPWLGPDVLDALRDLQATGTRDVVVCPIGFVADHLEVLYDLDVEAAGLAAALGMRLVRTPSLNASPAFVEVLADVAATALGAPQIASRQ
ncbi:MAG: ferrochelatase [Armatimonadota bacterium]|nr:ferrochelatase [Armatimonadota bacterium]MDR7533800.1 ferrochelatase [Armatimonadota bacterium]MDR7536671.1 ferrochelatase [Armatimonadota bacterium]